MGTRETKAGIGNALFTVYSRGIRICRDAWAYNFNAEELARNMRRTIATYNAQVGKWLGSAEKTRLDDFVLNDDSQIAWSRDLKLDVTRGKASEYEEIHIRQSIYRPFAKSYLVLR